MAQPADSRRIAVVVFSKDRPLQLHAALTSMRSACLDAERLRVRAIVYASDDAMAARYLQVARECPWAELVGEQGFKATLLGCLGPEEHLAFVVDDSLFVREWRAGSVIDALDAVPKAVGVSLRLGRNTTSCYTMARPQRVPDLLELSNGWLACDWTAAELDFGYPLELSSSVYRTRDLAPLLRELEYRNPNELEARLALAAEAFRSSHPGLLLPPASVAFSAPLNVVQRTFDNRSGGRADQSPEVLGQAFDGGARVDVGALRGYTPRGCHEELELPLLGRARVQADPAVSVVIPCHGQAEFLATALSSVAMQTFSDWEIVAVDDGSPDASAQVVRDLAARLPGRRIRLLRQANAGLANARNAGVRAARGRYILPLDADDALQSTFLERTVALLQADPGLDVAYTDVGIFGARDGVWETRRPFDLPHLLEENGLAYCALYRRAVFDRAGGYRANMSAGYEDWDFWVGAAAAGVRAGHLPEPLFLYREKGASMLSQARRHDRALRARLRLNHPSACSPAELLEAERLLAAEPLPPAKAATEPREEVLLAAPGPDRRADAAGPPATGLPPTPRRSADGRPTLPSAPSDASRSLEVLRSAGAWRDGEPLRLHLGCGERRLEGYVNVDLPPAAASIMATRADVFGDVPELRFPAGSVDEVRSHHVFEHFPRVEALALLIRWSEWLRPGGRLVIETPDLEGSARTLLSDQPLEVKMGVVRHLAGDQAEGWAFHVDQWFPERFRHTLARLGFGRIEVEQRAWPHPPFLSDVVVAAEKGAGLSRAVLLDRADELLAQSTVAAAERPTLDRWRTQLRARLDGGPLFPPAGAPAPAPTPAAAPPPAAPSPPAASAWIAAQPALAPRAEVVDFNQRQRDRWVAERAATVSHGARVLDVGAGTCPYRPRFAHCRYVTHDFKQYEGVKLGGGTDYGRIDLVSRVESIPAPDAAFDVVLCTEVLEHVPSPDAAVREMARLLAPGGRLLLTAPLGSGLHQLPYHYFGGFSPEWYREQARRCGLEIVSITPNGGFFKLMAQETARAADLLAAAGPALRPPPEVLELLGAHLPAWFHALDASLFVDQFTVGYFVEARRVGAAPGRN